MEVVCVNGAEVTDGRMACLEQDRIPSHVLPAIDPARVSVVEMAIAAIAAEMAYVTIVEVLE